MLASAPAGDARVAVTYNEGDIANYDEQDVNFTLEAGTVTVKAETPARGKITVSSVANALPDSDITLDVVITENPGINTFTLGFAYDTARLSLTNVTKPDSLPGQLQYSKKAVWLNSEDTTYTGTILTLTFHVLASAPAGDARVAVTYNEGDIANYNEQDVSFDLTAGSVTVSDPVTPRALLEIVPDREKVSRGTQFTVALQLQNNPGIAGLIVTLDYDSSVFTLTNVTNGTLFDRFSQQKNLVWTNNSGADTTVNGTLATLTFTAAEDAQPGSHTIGLTLRESVNAAQQDVAVTVTGGAVEVISIVYGDANGDEKVNIKDVVLLNQYLANYDYDTGTSTVTVGPGADANGDNKVSVKDVVLLNQYLANYDYDTGTSTVALGPQG